MTYQFTNAHLLGTAWVSHQYGLAYINIPKCASTSVKHTLRNDYGFRQVTVVDPNYWCFTVVREPFSRLCSGLIEYAARNRAGEDVNPLLDEVIVNPLLDEVIEELEAGFYTPRDEHTTPQHVFITRRVDRLIPMETLDTRLPPLLAEWGLPTRAAFPRRQTTPDDISSFVRDYLKPHWSTSHDPIDSLLHRYALLT